MSKTDLENAKKILKKYNQEHLLNFYDKLSVNQKEILINQILSIDFDEIFSLYDNSMTDNFPLTQKVSPLPYIGKCSLS